MNEPEETNIERMLRTRSLLVSAFPWCTDAVVLLQPSVQWCPPEHFFHQFVRQMYSYEHHLESASGRQALALRSLLKIRPAPAGLSDSFASESDVQQLCCLLCDYRLIDVVAHVEDWPLSAGVPRHRKQPNITTNFRGYAPLNNLRSLLLNFKEAMNSLGSLNDPLLTSSSARSRLVRSLCRTHQAESALGFVTNIEFAALHAHYILMETFSPSSLPDIPTDVTMYLANDLNDAAKQMSLSDGDQSELHSVLQTLRASGLRTPLLAVLMISPFVWFLSNQLWKGSWGILDIVLQAWLRGNMKPAFVTALEKKAWSEFLKVVKGQQSAHACLEAISQSISTESLNEVSEDDLTWFHAEYKSVRRKLPAVAMDLNEMIPENWPLRTVLLEELGESLRVGGAPYSNGRVPSMGQPGAQEHQQQSTPLIDSTEVALQIVADPSPSTSTTTIAATETGVSPETTPQNNPLKRSDRLLEKLKQAHGLLPSPADVTVEEPASKGRRAPKRKFQQSESGSSQRRRTADKKRSKLSQRDIVIKEGGTVWNPIDVDSLTAPPSEITVEAQTTVWKLKKWECSPSFLSLSGFETSHEIEVIGHSEDTLECFANSVQYVHDNFINGSSFHYTDPPRSVFHCLSTFHFNQKSVVHLQEFFRVRHLVIRDASDDRFLFDKRGLSSLEKLSSVITVHDHSLEFENCFNEIAREGTLKQLLESARTDRKILSAMSVPMYSVAMVSGPLFSETAAWKATNSDAYCRDDAHHEEPMPVGDMRRGMAGTHGSLKWWNIETDGLASMIEVKTGLLYVIVFRPSGTEEGSLRGMKPNFEQFYAQWSVKKPFQPVEDPVLPPVCEGICLPKGDRIYLRPNTPHMIYFAADSICHVSHFYATSTMQHSLVAILQSFVLGEHISDAARPRTRRFIQRLIHFYHRSYVDEKVPEEDDEDLGHLPHLNTCDSIFDIVAVCVLGILANVLDPRTYVFPGQKTGSTLTDEAKTAVDTYDANGLDYLRRLKYIHTRSLSYEVLDWLSASFIFTPAGSATPVHTFRDVFAPYIAHVCNTLFRHKVTAAAQELPGIPFCTSSALRTQILMCLGKEPDISPLLNLADDPDAPPGSFAWRLKSTFTIARDTSPDLKDRSGVSAERGFTDGDRKFLSASDYTLPTTALGAKNHLPVRGDDEQMEVDTSDDDYDPPTKKKRS